MGIFDFLGEIAGDVVCTLWDGVEFVVDSIKSGVSNVKKWVKEVLNIEELPEYDINEATVEETQKVNELLEKCIENYTNEARKYDEMAKKIIEEYYGNLIKKFMELNSISKETIIDSYFIQSFQSNYKRVQKALGKIYSKQIANVFSLNNNKLLDILALPSGEEKKEKISTLALNTIIGANSILMRTLEESINEQEKFISVKLKDYMENREANLLIAQKETEKILKNYDENSTSRIKIEENYNKIIEKLDLISEVLSKKC